MMRLSGRFVLLLAVTSLVAGVVVAQPSAKTADEKVITNSIGMKLVLIPAGKFKMGSPKDEKGRRDDEEQHEVEITRPFYMGMHTVTVGSFRAFVKDSGFQTDAEKDGKGGWGYNKKAKRFEGYKPEYTWRSVGWVQSDEHPVVDVSWNDAIAFCDWLSKKERQQYRLPTEAEWEYGCRAGTTTRFYSGDADDSLQSVANIGDASLNAQLNDEYSKYFTFTSWNDKYPFTAPVGEFQANAFGLYDMHGNVWQWCSDWYDKSYYKSSPKQDPKGPAIGFSQGPATGPSHVIRGGSFTRATNNCRSAFRVYGDLEYKNYNGGFRVVREK